MLHTQSQHPNSPRQPKPSSRIPSPRERTRRRRMFMRQVNFMRAARSRPHASAYSASGSTQSYIARCSSRPMLARRAVDGGGRAAGWGPARCGMPMRTQVLGCCRRHYFNSLMQLLKRVMERSAHVDEVRRRQPLPIHPGPSGSFNLITCMCTFSFCSRCHRIPLYFSDDDDDDVAHTLPFSVQTDVFTSPSREIRVD